MGMDAYNQDDIRDEKLAAQFFPIVQQPDAWPTLESETKAYQAQRDAWRRDVYTLVSDVTSYVARMG